MGKRSILLIVLLLFVAAAGSLVFLRVTHSSFSDLMKKANRQSFGKPLVVGTWDDLLDNQSLEFSPDDTVTMTVKDTRVPGTYTLNEKDSSLTVVVNGADINFFWKNDRLTLASQGFSSDAFAKRPAESGFLTIPCAATISGVLADKGNGNYQMPEPKLTSTDPNLTLMMLPGAQWTHKGEKDTSSGAECVGYTRSIDEIVEDIRIRGKEAPNPSNHKEAIFAVAEVRQ